jgi:hypothetical protein
MAINPIQRSLRLQNIASVIDTDAYFPNDQTSNGEAKGNEDEGQDQDDEGKIKQAGSKPR